MGKKYKSKASAAKYDYASDGTYNSDEDEYSSSGMYHQQQTPDYYYPQSSHYTNVSASKHKAHNNNSNINNNKEPAYKMNKYQTIVLKVQVHCDACLKKVKKAAADIDGVESINVDVRLKRVSITGYIDPKKVLKKVAKTGKQVELVGSSTMISSGNNMLYNTYSNAYNVNSNFNANAKSLLLPFDTRSMDIVNGHHQHQQHHHSSNSNHKNHNSNSNMNSNLLNNSSLMIGGGSSSSAGGKNKQHALSMNHHLGTSNNMLGGYNSRMLVLQNPQARNDLDHIFSDDNANNCSIM